MSNRLASRTSFQSRWLASQLAAILSLFVSLCTAASETPAPPTLDVGLENRDHIEQLSDRIKQLTRSYQRAVVRVLAEDQHGKLSGTGFYGDPTGLVYTTISNLGDGEHLWICIGDANLPARLLVKDPETGIALLKVDQPTPDFLLLGDASHLEPASLVLALGYPFAMDLAPSFGLVAGFDKQFSGHYFRVAHARLNVPVQRGYSGAPVLDLDGRVVGMIVSNINGGAGCYMIPVHALKKIRMDYTRFEAVRPGWLGISTRIDPNTKAASCVRIEAVMPNSPAEQSGIERGDVLLSIGNKTITTPDDLPEASFFLTSGDETVVSVLHNHQLRSFHLKATDPPAAPKRKRLSTQDLLFPSGH